MKFKNTLQWALDYIGLGWSIIPLQFKDKRPLIRWNEFQHRRAEAEEVKGWFRRWPEANLAIVTGAISGLVVIDADPQHAGEKASRDWKKSLVPFRQPWNP